MSPRKGPDFGLSLLLDNLRGLSRRDLIFVLACSVVALIAWHPLKTLALAVTGLEQNTHILLVLPVIVMLLMLERPRKAPFETVDWTGIPILLGAGATWLLLTRYADGLFSADRLSVSILGIVIAWIGLAVFFYGKGVLRRRAFLVFFLFLLVTNHD